MKRIKQAVNHVWDYGSGNTKEGRYFVELSCGHGDFYHRAPQIGALKTCEACAIAARDELDFIKRADHSADSEFEWSRKRVEAFISKQRPSNK